jgi:hypothetical protein
MKLWWFAFTYLTAVTFVTAQEPSKPTGAAPEPANRASLEFSMPETIKNLGPGAMVAGRFDCGDNGTIYALVQGAVTGTNADPKPDGEFALLGIHPDGAVRSFPWWAAPGFSRILTIRSTFVGNGQVFLLVRGERANEGHGLTARSEAVLKFDANGILKDSVALARNMSPWVLGVFPSGNLLLVSEDRLNHRVALDLVDQHGVFIRRLKLNQNDLLERAAQLPHSRRGTGSYSPGFLIGSSRLVPWNGHLLLVPLLTSGLPISEIGEDGIISSTDIHLPEKVVLESILSSSDSTFTVQLGEVLDSGTLPTDSEGRLIGVGTRPLDRITEISRISGGVVREIDLGSAGPEPACETGGTYRLLISDSQKELQTVSATIR